MIQSEQFLIDECIDLQAMGQRLGLVVAKYENGREGAQNAADISSFTLDRYLAGKTKRIDLICMAAICRAQSINLNWLIYGQRHPMDMNS